MADFTTRVSLVRPISAKKKKKYELFSPPVSCGRLRRVQSLIKSEGLSALLCILGIDSRYNSGTKQLLNYLLFGYCNIAADSISSKVTDEILEDVVVLVKLESVHVYCNPLNYPHLLPLIGHWRNLHIHCLAEEEDDDEKQEEFKILSFVSMVNGCSNIGIPYGKPGEHDKPFDPFLVEKWPLIQAFAIEGLGGGGFFTMEHEIKDVTSKMEQLFGMIDPVVVEMLLTERLPLFGHHCKAVLTNIDVESSSSNSFGELKENQVAEPIMSYFTHGQMAKGNSSASDNPRPFVLFGVNTSRKNIQLVRQSHASESKNKIVGSGLRGSKAKHTVCFARDPRGTITSARTYFFANGFVPYTGKEPSRIVFSKDLRLMLDLYLLAIDAVLEGIRIFVKCQDLSKSKSAILSALNGGLGERKISLDPSLLYKNVEISVQAFDLSGSEFDLQTSMAAPVIKMVCLYIYDIPSIEQPGNKLGSIAFGETFLDSVVRTILPDSSSVLDCNHLVLTENITRFATWQNDEEKTVSRNLEELVKSKEKSDELGEQLIMGDQGFLMGNQTRCKWEEGTVYVYEKGILFSNSRFGFVTLPLSQVDKIQFYDGETSSVIALVMLHYKPELASHLPLHLINEHHTLTLALAPRTRIFRQFYSEVLPLWKNAKGQAKLEEVFEIPDDLTKIHKSLGEHLPHTLSFGTDNRLQHVMSMLPDLRGFLAHLNVSSTSDVPLRSKDLTVALGTAPETPTESDNSLELSLTILTGVPGSGKDELCSTLVALAKENSKWIILKSPISSSQPFDPEGLQASLTTTLTSQRRLHARLSASRRRLKVIVVTPGFTDIVDVVMAIANHPNAEVYSHVKIGAITCCVNPENVFMENRYTLPKLLDQCAQGFVNNIVFTSCLDAQNEQLSAVQKLIRVCNPQAAFILAKDGKVTRTPDVELILSETAFDEVDSAQRRHLMCPGWTLGDFNSGGMEPPINEIFIEFYKPLERHRFQSKLKEMKGQLCIAESLDRGAVHSIRGHVRFSDHNTISEVHWTSLIGHLSQSLVETNNVPRPPSKPAQNGNQESSKANLAQFLVFTGFALKKDSLMDWLRGCIKPTPQKQPLVSKKTLSKKELDDIKGKHKCDTLPEGWFYTGTQYVSLTGEKAYQHPLLEQYIEQYVQDKNEEIKRHNASVDINPHQDMFLLPEQ
ncbi:dynein axonemal assembly factor 9 isoform X2 [Nematostella vectensis]|uniref:dynein axonemal assembly factor 9 isoform X1 n=2 Tax=Nematostella vectensis TaxID=45351 RepID=UPI0020776D33|nr:dynein axonemal assembly factor 9 isoform X1 [Nematostella vectensis]XP_048584617.1 dynein axonemal assembly factor 9 isoform X2 [Nematostella vectensis]